MKNLFAIVLLVTAMAVTGCGEKKKPAATPPANTGGEAKPAEGGAVPPATTPPAEPAK